MKANHSFRSLFSTRWLLLSSLGLLCSCATTQHINRTSEKKSAVSRARTQQFALHRELKKQQAVIEELREKNLVLERRLQIQTAPPLPPIATDATPLVAAPASVQVNPKLDPEAQALVAAVKGLPQLAPVRRPVDVDPSLDGDKLLYSKVLETYRRHDAGEMKKAVDILIKTYPDSIHADNALYLEGLLAVEKEDRANALLVLERALREYPNGNKAVASLFLKAIVEKQLGQFPEARRDLNLVARIYPGSPEARRVNLELRLFDIKKSTAKSSSATNSIGEM